MALQTQKSWENKTFTEENILDDIFIPHEFPDTFWNPKGAIEKFEQWACDNKMHYQISVIWLGWNRDMTCYSIELGKDEPDFVKILRISHENAISIGRAGMIALEKGIITGYLPYSPEHRKEEDYLGSFDVETTFGAGDAYWSSEISSQEEAKFKPGEVLDADRLNKIMANIGHSFDEMVVRGHGKVVPHGQDFYNFVTDTERKLEGDSTMSEDTYRVKEIIVVDRVNKKVIHEETVITPVESGNETARLKVWGTLLGSGVIPSGHTSNPGRYKIFVNSRGTFEALEESDDFLEARLSGKPLA